MTAHHFTLPAWFAALGSFGDERARTYYWRRHIEFLAETFGDLVYGWKPINEPHAYAMAGWLLGRIPPGHTSMAEAGRMLVATHLANYEAWKALRGGGQPVATIQNLSPVSPASDSPADRAAAGIVRDLAFGCWIRMVRDGVLQLPALPGQPERERIVNPGFVGAFDLIGFSYYNATSVAANPSPASSTGIALGPYPPGRQPGQLGYVPWSEGLGLVLDQLHEETSGSAAAHQRVRHRHRRRRAAMPVHQ